MDPREIRTKAALSKALRTLIKQNPLATIDVVELCREAGIHRTTFYGHYASIDELAVDVFAAEIDVAATVNLEVATTTTEMVAELIEATRRLLVLVKEDVEAFRALFLSPVSLGFRRILTEFLRQRVAIAVQGFAERGVESIHSTAVSEGYIAGGIVGAIEAFSLSDVLDVDQATNEIVAAMPNWWPQIEGQE